jgi:hypothetical protein
MSVPKQRIVSLLVVLLNVLLVMPVDCQQTPPISLREAPLLQMPGAYEFGYWGVDGNSPAERAADGGLILFNSLQYPWRSVGPDLFNLNAPERVTINEREAIEGGLWLEATYRDQDGTLFGWFHNEVEPGCENVFLKTPQIRQMFSRDEGRTWTDLGVVLSASGDTFDCGTANAYFAGGNGDFSVLFDQATRHFYFVFTVYNREQAEQGIGFARLPYDERYNLVGNVWRWDGADWTGVGVGGRGATIWQPAVSWHRPDADAFWGPALHFNTHLQQYVMLLNRAIDAGWSAEGVYLSFNRDLTNPAGWSEPRRLPLEMESTTIAYPQVIGLDVDSTDKLAGRVARLFLSGVSNWEIVFEAEPVLTAPQRPPGRADDRERYPRREP